MHHSFYSVNGLVTKPIEKNRKLSCDDNLISIINRSKEIIMKNVYLIVFLFVSAYGFPQSKIQKVDSLLLMLNKQSQFNGNVLIKKEGEILLKKSYGLANRTAQIELNENSVFELASLSKQFTATGIVLLKQDGKLNYNDKIVKYFPELLFCKGVTIKHLLNHTSGIPEYMGLMINKWDKKKTATNIDIIKMLSMNIDSLKFEPNEKFDYSNSNYVLLATIIEKVSNQEYSTFMEERVFNPLKMDNSLVLNRRYKPRHIDNYAYGYVLGENQSVVLPDSVEFQKYVVYLDGIVGDGMVNSTINDLDKWDESIRNYTLIHKNEFEYIQELDTLNNGEVNNYTFGWRVNDNGGDITMSHSGGWPGYVTYISRNVNKNEIIVILQNFDEIVLPIEAIEEILNDLPVSKKYKKEIHLSRGDLEKYIGKYVDVEDSQSITTLIMGKNALIYNSTNNPWNMPFYPDSKYTFFSKVPRMNLAFEFITDNEKVRLIFLQNGIQIGQAIRK